MEPFGKKETLEDLTIESCAEAGVTKNVFISKAKNNVRNILFITLCQNEIDLTEIDLTIEVKVIKNRNTIKRVCGYCCVADAFPQAKRKKTLNLYMEIIGQTTIY